MAAVAAAAAAAVFETMSVESWHKKLMSSCWPSKRCGSADVSCIVSLFWCWRTTFFLRPNVSTVTLHIYQKGCFLVKVELELKLKGEKKEDERRKKLKVLAFVLYLYQHTDCLYEAMCKIQLALPVHSVSCCFFGYFFFFFFLLLVLLFLFFFLFRLFSTPILILLHSSRSSVDLLDGLMHQLGELSFSSSSSTQKDTSMVKCLLVQVSPTLLLFSLPLGYLEM